LTILGLIFKAVTKDSFTILGLISSCCKGLVDHFRTDFQSCYKGFVDHFRTDFTDVAKGSLTILGLVFKAVTKAR
jgi:hypothetical protein